MKKLIKIYSNEHSAWWKPDYCGYTNDVYKAGVFDYDDAIKKYPYINYNKNGEDYFVDITPKMIISEMEDIEYEISKLQEKLQNLRTIIKEVE